MFCYQCEQASKGTGCTEKSVCGKTPETAALQDALYSVVQGIGSYAHYQRQQGVKDRALDLFVIEGLFTTVTNVNFDSQRVLGLIEQGIKMRQKLRTQNPQFTLPGDVWKDFSGSAQQVAEQASKISILSRLKTKGPDVTGLEELICYGLKGMAAYADHALINGVEDDEVFGFIHEVLAFLTVFHSVDQYLAMALKVGEVNLKVMEMLDRANTGSFGIPEPSKARITAVKGKAILVSGHELKDLEELLKQTQGKGINVYTHGEMLPALGYPKLKKYSHLVGNYGGAWQDQGKEFAAFPGAILMTTNCLQDPAKYQDRIFTTGLVAWPHVCHVTRKDFSPVIAKALALPGFTIEEPAKYITVGMGHGAILQVADKVVDAVKSGAIKHFFVIGGCDGAKSGRNYFTEIAEQLPQDAVVLTLGCGKFRFNKYEFGEIGGIPRLLDLGQCNDAYGAIKVAVALASAFQTDVNSLPLSLLISWYEQKAVAVLLTLLHLGIKNIRLGPSLPAFVSPSVLQVLSEKFQLRGTGNVKDDLKSMLGA